MAKLQPAKDPEIQVSEESPILGTGSPAPSPEAKPTIEAAPEISLLGLALLKFEYADKKTGEPMPLLWKPNVIGEVCGIVSKFGTLLYPDQSVAKFTHAEAVEVRRYLAALRPNDEIQITNLQ